MALILSGAQLKPKDFGIKVANDDTAEAVIAVTQQANAKLTHEEGAKDV